MEDTIPDQPAGDIAGPANRFAREIGALSNKKWEGQGGSMSVLIGARVCQDLAISLFVGPFKPGSDEGKKLISDFYDGLKADALRRWDDQDLELHYARRKKK